MKIKISDLLQAINESAPPMLQESWDNTGLLVGDPEMEVHHALLTLDVTENIVEEAISRQCGLIIAHHPPIFKGLKSITTKNPVERAIMMAIKADIAIAAVHTNADNVLDGVNGMIAQKLGLKNLRILQPMNGMLKKLVVFCPAAHAAKVREAMFAAGAGHIGDYDSCSYNLEGYGTFRAGDSTNPFVGEKNKLHEEQEQRIETIVPAFRLDTVVKAMTAAHPYEEVAYDIYPLDNMFTGAGSGLVGELEDERSEEEFLKHISKSLQNSFLRHSELTAKPIKKVAVCGGSGAFLIHRAIASGADAFVTADIKYHDFFEADGKLLLVDAGHFETEQFTKELLFGYLKKKFPNFAPLISGVNTNAVHYFYDQK